MAKLCPQDCISGRQLFPGDNCEGCGDERAIHDILAAEPAILAGVNIRLYSLRRAKNRHPLYKEPSHDGKDWAFQGPFEMFAELEFPQSSNTTPEVTEVGRQVISDAILKIPRTEIERAEAPFPKEGDVVEFWWEGQFATSVGYRQWDVTKASSDGNIWSTAQFVGYYIELKSRTKFLAFRKTEHTKI
jgi:hypothetical protein